MKPALYMLVSINIFIDIDEEIDLPTYIFFIQIFMHYIVIKFYIYYTRVLQVKLSLYK